jgi:hypothetical protein
MCGLDEAVKDKPYLFFFDLAKCAQTDVIIHGCATPQVQSKLWFVVNVHLCQHLSQLNPWLPMVWDPLAY